MSSVRRWQGVLRQLNVLLEALPSPQERDDIVRGITGIIEVLDKLGTSLGNLPTSIEAAKAKDALEKLENILGRNPLLRGSPPKAKEITASKSPSRHRKPSDMSIPKDHILKEMAALDQLPEDALRARLQQQDHYSKEFLRVILTELGRRASSKVTRKEMIEQIVVAIINRRTYEGLRGNEVDAP